MGKGAYVQIGNASSKTINVGYWNFSCMHQNGEDGSDFAPITGLVHSGGSLPATGTAQYIEADSSGTCASQQSTVNIVLQLAGEGREAPAGTFALVESGNQWTLNDKSSYSTQVAGGLRFTLTIGATGDQYYITAMVVDDAS